METLVSEPQSKITETDIQQYEKDGVVCLRGMFDPGWIEYMRKAIEKAKDKPGPLAQVYTKEDEPGHSWGDHAVWERIPEFRDFVFNSPGPAIARKANPLTLHKPVLRPFDRQGTGNGPENTLASGPALLGGKGPTTHHDLDTL